jgi:FMNH2-dependent dimethyl sulfone monooxygenase
VSLELGFFIPAVPPPIAVTMARQAEEDGFDFITCDDHMMNPFEPMQEGAEDFGVHEAWTQMSFLAGATSSISVSHMVLVPTFRGPGLLAKMAATLDQFSGGRMDLTIGAGWYEKEYHAFNFPWEDHPKRLAREREIVHIIRSLWTEESTTFDGEYYQLKEATILPKPLQKPTPAIWISGNSKRSLQLAADLGDGLLVHGNKPEAIAKIHSVLTSIRGNKMAGFGLGTATFVVMAEDQDAATRKVERIISPQALKSFESAGIRHELKHRISGNAQQCLDKIKEYEQAGLTRLITIFIDPDDAKQFAREVLPQLR